MLQGLTGYQTQAAFSSSKGAVIPFAKSLAVAWYKFSLYSVFNGLIRAPSNIQVNCVLPGAVNTEFNAPLLVRNILFSSCLDFVIRVIRIRRRVWLRTFQLDD